ncbi:MAG: PKD domain-containing protein [Flavobacteriales bacterium]|nr:PKD domain-containing protein [Flavobacteriales bacterium]
MKNISLSILLASCSLFGVAQVAPPIQQSNSASSTVSLTYQSRRTHINPEFCATDHFHNKKMATDSLYRYKHEESVNRYTKLPINKNPVNGIYQVPVVVHVMHKGEAVGSGTNISDADVRLGIQYLNNYWRKITGTYGDGNGVDMEIEFTLAVQDESGNCTDGIDRVDMSGVSSYVNNGVNRNNTNGLNDYTAGGGVNSLKEYSIWNPTEYYNVWIVDEIDNKNCYTGGSYTAGYAYYASSHGQPWDGSVVLICSYLDESSDTWAHEMGHAFNLPHTFDGDNYPSVCGDDGISDTPQHFRTSDIPGLYFDCGNTDPNTCDPSFNQVMSPTHTGNGTHQDHMLNYMDYTGCSSEFTFGQRTVAKSAMTVERASFLTSPALTPPVVATVDFTSTTTAICANSSVTFYDQSSCTPNTYTNNGYTGISFLWTFDNGGTPITSTDQNPTITFTSAGSYNVTLQVTNPSGTSSKTVNGYLNVSSGTVTAACTPTSSNPPANYGYTMSNITFNTLSNTTSGSMNQEYVDYSCSHATTVNPDSSYTMSVTLNNGSTYSEDVDVYIDYNDDGTFSAGEKVMSATLPAGTGTGTFNQVVTIPTSPTTGKMLRMRAYVDANGTGAVCSNTFVGDIEDYGVYIATVSTCNDPDVPTISGTTTICNGNSTTLSIATGNLNDATDWQWYTSSCGGTSAGNGTSINVSPTTTTTYYVRGEGGCVSPGSCAQVTVTVNDVPGNAGSITGSTSVCENATGVTYSISSVSGATNYTWTVPSGATITAGQGSTSITVSFGTTAGNVAVTPSNTCGNGGGNSVAVSINTVPGNAGSITGSGSVCQNATGIGYSIAAVSGATNYTWTVPSGATITAGQGSTSITVSFGTTSGNVAVTPSNTCGNGGSNSMAVTVNACGAPPVADFSGSPTTLCEGNSVSFTDLSTNTPTSWSWSFPGGTPSSSSAQNPTVTYASAGTYAVTLTASNAFGSDPITKTGYITVNACGVTQLRSQDCGLVMTDYLNYITCDWVANADAYQYEFSNTGLGYTQTYTRHYNWKEVYVFLVPGIQNNTTYDVRVRAKVNGIWSSYGSVCQITTPANDVTTRLMSAYCGITLNNYSQFIKCEYVAEATDYQYEFSNTGLGYTQTYNRLSSWREVYLNDVAGILDNTTYNVRVRAKVNGVWTNYGSVCQVTTPSTGGVTKLRSGDCGIVMTDYANYITCDYAAGATDYEYEFSNTGLSYTQTYTRSSSWREVYVHLVPGIQNNTTYNVRVRAKINGIWSAYGTTCQITTPANGITTKLINNDCGIVMSSYSNYITCDYVAGATNYQYEFSNIGLGYNQIMNRHYNWRYVYVNDVPGIQLSTTYDVRVRAKINGVWGSFGTVCQITTPSSLRLGTPSSFDEEPQWSDVNELEMIIYPNPNSGDFVYLDLKGLDQDAELIITDISGKVIQQQVINTDETDYNSTLRFNEKLNSGFYLVTVVSGTHKITRKLIVR